MIAHRIQRQRTAGFRLPVGVVYVGRPSKFANPFRVVPAASRRGGRRDMWAVMFEDRTLGRYDEKRDAAQDAVDRYRLYVAERGLEGAIWAELAGQTLACWCPETMPCHADVLLEIASGVVL